MTAPFSEISYRDLAAVLASAHLHDRDEELSITSTYVNMMSQ